MKLILEVQAQQDERGFPALVLVVGGKVLHYNPEMTIGELFSKCKAEESDNGYRPIMPVETPKQMAERQRDETDRGIIQSVRGIQERDVVKCVNISRRDDGLTLTLGKEYTVIKKMRMKDPEAGPGERKFITILEVLDVDYGRIQVFESDMEFVRHNAPAQAPAYDKYEETRVCDKCHQNFSVWKLKTGGEYQGECPCVNESAEIVLEPVVL